MSITKSRAKFLCFQLEKKSKESIKKKKTQNNRCLKTHFSPCAGQGESLYKAEFSFPWKGVLLPLSQSEEVVCVCAGCARWKGFLIRGSCFSKLPHGCIMTEFQKTIEEKPFSSQWDHENEKQFQCDFFVYFGNRSVGHIGDKRRYFPYRFSSIFIYNSINIGHRLTIWFLLQLMDSLSLVDDLISFLTVNSSAGEGFFPFITFHFKYLYGSYLIREALFMLKPHSPNTPAKVPRGALPRHLSSKLEEISSARYNQDLLYEIPLLTSRISIRICVDISLYA